MIKLLKKWSFKNKRTIKIRNNSIFKTCFFLIRPCNHLKIFGLDQAAYKRNMLHLHWICWLGNR